MRIEENIKMDKGLSLISMTFFDLTNIIYFLLDKFISYEFF